MQRTYRVTGRWPFPTDMLRHDRAQAATPADAALIERMSGETTDDAIGLDLAEIELTMDSGEPTRSWPLGRLLPNTERWESFGWTVSGDPDVNAIRAARDAAKVSPVAHARDCLDLLRRALVHAKAAGSSRTAARIRAAIASADGAVRHAENRASR